MSCPRPPTRADKGAHIMSIAELKKAMEKTRQEGIDEMGGIDFAFVDDILKLLDEFETSVRERIVDCEKTIRNLGDNPYVRMKLDEFLKSKMLELRRILDGDR